MHVNKKFLCHRGIKRERSDVMSIKKRCEELYCASVDFGLDMREHLDGYVSGPGVKFDSTVAILRRMGRIEQAFGDMRADDYALKSVRQNVNFIVGELKEIAIHKRSQCNALRLFGVAAEEMCCSLHLRLIPQV